MKLSKNGFLILGAFFTLDFIYTLFNKSSTHGLFIWTIDMWVYRGYRLLLAMVFIVLYFVKKDSTQKV